MAWIIGSSRAWIWGLLSIAGIAAFERLTLTWMGQSSIVFSRGRIVPSSHPVYVYTSNRTESTPTFSHQSVALSPVLHPSLFVTLHHDRTCLYRCNATSRCTPTNHHATVFRLSSCFATFLSFLSLNFFLSPICGAGRLASSSAVFFPKNPIKAFSGTLYLY